MDVAVRELKQNLSKFLERAARGETIRVTDRGKPKAVIGPLPDRLRLDDGVEEGWVSAPDGKVAKAVRRARAKRTSAELLAEDRES